MTNQIDTLTTAITAWDMQDVRALRDLIADLKTACDEAEYDFQGTIDMANLPSAQIPDDIDTSYPVWAVDAQGMALVGPNADEIESLDLVRETYPVYDISCQELGSDWESIGRAANERDARQLLLAHFAGSDVVIESVSLEATDLGTGEDAWFVEVAE